MKELIGMDGECAVKLLKQTCAARCIPVLLFTACNKIEKIAVNSQVDGYIKKPFNIDDDSKTIEEKIRSGSEAALIKLFFVNKCICRTGRNNFYIKGKKM